MTPKQRIKAFLAARSSEAASENQEHTQPSAETKNAPTHTASVPFMITRRMEADLRQCGFSQERINTMTPSEAWEILQTEAGRIAVELKGLQCDGAIRDMADAEFYASLIKAFDATYAGAGGAEKGEYPVDCVPDPPPGISPQERMEFYKADLEDAIGSEFIDRDYQPQVFHTRSSTRKKKR
jgi:hypothetical protein